MSVNIYIYICTQVYIWIYMCKYSAAFLGEKASGSSGLGLNTNVLWPQSVFVVQNVGKHGF